MRTAPGAVAAVLLVVLGRAFAGARAHPGGEPVAASFVAADALSGVLAAGGAARGRVGLTAHVPEDRGAHLRRRLRQGGPGAHPGGAGSIAADPSTSIGNHHLGHPYCTSLSDAELRSEVTRAEEEIRSVTGRDPRPLFRFPYGDRDARTLADVNAAGYGSIRWTVDTLGWEGTAAGRSAATVLQRVKDGERPGEIVLMHLGAAPDGSTLDADALPAIIKQLRGDGYGFVAIWDFVSGLS